MSIFNVPTLRPQININVSEGIAKEGVWRRKEKNRKEKKRKEREEKVREKATWRRDLRRAKPH